MSNKYTNISFNSLYKKLLYKKRFIICEGYTDVICLHSHGYPAVASLGTALTDEQIEKIFNVVDEAFLVFDGDIAGKNATERVFYKKKISFRSFEIIQKNEKTLGELFCFFILETILLGKLLNVNPYDQPSVELIKKETKKNLIF